MKKITSKRNLNLHQDDQNDKLMFETSRHRASKSLSEKKKREYWV